MLARLMVAPVYISLAILKPELPMFLPSLESYSAETPRQLAIATNAVLFTYIVITWWTNVQFIGAFLWSYVFSTLAAIHSLRSVSM